MSFRRPRSLALAASALALGASLMAARPVAYLARAAGYSYTFRVATHLVDAKGKARDDSPMIARVQVAGDRARMDIQETQAREGGGGMMKKGGWMIADRAKRTLTMVDPEEKTYTTMPIDGFGQMMGGMLGSMGKMMKIKVSDAKFATENLGNGGIVNGLPTKHYRVTHDYVIDMQVMFSKQHNTVHTDAEYWVNDDVKSHANPLFEMMGSIGAGMMASDSAFGRQVKDAMQKLFVGVPVKSVSTTVSTNAKGEKTTSTSTMEMLDFHRGDVPTSIFDVPAGYTENTVTEADMAKGREGQQEASDSLSAHQGDIDRAQAMRDSAEAAAADSAAKAGQPSGKDAAKSAAKKKLRGMFGKP